MERRVGFGAIPLDTLQFTAGTFIQNFIKTGLFGIEFGKMFNSSILARRNQKQILKENLY